MIRYWTKILSSIKNARYEGSNVLNSDGFWSRISKSDDAAWFNILSRISEGKYKGFIGMLYTTKYDIDGTELGIKARWIGDGKHQEQLISG